MREQAIMTIDDFRKITGFEASQVNDEQVRNIINRLDTIAKVYINQRRDEEKVLKNVVPNSP